MQGTLEQLIAYLTQKTWPTPKRLLAPSSRTRENGMSARDHENIKGVEIDPVKKEISQ